MALSKYVETHFPGPFERLTRNAQSGSHYEAAPTVNDFYRRRLDKGERKGVFQPFLKEKYP
jgi:hypothetical protein